MSDLLNVVKLFYKKFFSIKFYSFTLIIFHTNINKIIQIEEYLTINLRVKNITYTQVCRFVNIPSLSHRLLQLLRKNLFT